MTVEYIMPADAAVLLLAWLESRGAITALDEDNFIYVGMDAITNFGKFTPEALAYSILGLRDEIRQILIARRIVH